MKWLRRAGVVAVGALIVRGWATQRNRVRPDRRAEDVQRVIAQLNGAPSWHR